VIAYRDESAISKSHTVKVVTSSRISEGSGFAPFQSDDDAGHANITAAHTTTQVLLPCVTPRRNVGIELFTSFMSLQVVSSGEEKILPLWLTAVPKPFSDA
jgi:hypothetical protein